MATATPKAPANDLPQRKRFVMGAAMWSLLGLFVVGQLAVALYCRSFTGFSVGFLVSLMGLAAGAFIGFLFGIPRVVPGSLPVNDGKSRVQSSSSLQEVADWFVKLLLGAGLAQLDTVGGHIMGLAAMVERGFTAGGEACAEFPCLLPGSTAVALGIVVSHPIIGFLLSFLWTRLRLILLFNDTERDLSTQEVEQLVGQKLMSADMVRSARGVGKKGHDPAKLKLERSQVRKTDPKDLDPEGRIAWARLAIEIAKPPGATKDDIARAEQAREVLDAALREDPSLAGDELATETRKEVHELDLLTPLYESRGYEKLLAKYPPDERANLTGQQLGYLVAALGQKHADAAGNDRAKIADEAYDLMQEATAKEPSLAQWFEMLLHQDESSPDNDLATLGKEPRFKEWLQKRGAPR